MSAHLDGDAIKTQNYMYEVAFAQPPEIRADNSLVIYVEDGEGNRLENKKVWLRLSYKDRVLMSSTNFVTDEFGAITLSYSFKDYGNYKLDISVDGEKATYGFQIKNTTNFMDYFVLLLILVVIFGFTKYRILRK